MTLSATLPSLPALPALLTGAAAVGSGLVGGVFFAFSGFVLPALSRLPPAAGTGAMQAVNRAAVAPPLMTALFGTAALATAAVVTAAAALRAPAGDGTPARAVLVLAGAGLYLVGGVLVTVVANVPLNDRLAGAVPGSPAADQTWEQYVRAWGAWNHVRTAGCLAASALLTAAALRPAGPA